MDGGGFWMFGWLGYVRCGGDGGDVENGGNWMEG